jgi:hypothetical protein
MGKEQTHGPEQVDVRALADGLKLAVWSDDVHLQEVVNAKAIIWREERMSTALKRNSVETSSNEHQKLTHQQPTPSCANLWRVPTNERDVLTSGISIRI